VSAAVAMITCAECGAVVEKRSPQHRFCSDRCRWRHDDRTNPSAIANNRRRCARWAQENRGVKERNPWLLGAPPFEPHLPGGAMEIHFENRMVFEHRQLSALHGVVTSLTGQHERNTPRFSLIPWHRGCGWGVYMRHCDEARQLSNTEHSVRIGSGRAKLKFGNMFRFRAPSVRKRGHRKLRIDAITPVCVRCTHGADGTQKLYTAPTSGNLLSTLVCMIPKRIELMVEPDSARLELLERDTVPATFRLAGRDGRLGNMRGWVGSVIVDCNAVAHWLLLVAERIGYGGTTSFGFGRIRVSEC